MESQSHSTQTGVTLKSQLVQRKHWLLTRHHGLQMRPPHPAQAAVCLGNNWDWPVQRGSELQGHQTGIFSPKARMKREMKEHYLPPGAAQLLGVQRGTQGTWLPRPSLLGPLGQRQ